MNSTTNPHQQNQHFDLNPFRGFICLWITAFHLFGPAAQAISRMTGWADFSQWADRNRLGVECFFVLTGFLLAHSLRNTPADSVHLGRLALRRTVRILIPYQISLLLSGLVLLFTSQVIRHEAFPDLVSWALALLVVGDVFQGRWPISSFWSMQPMFQFQFAIALLLILGCVIGVSFRSAGSRFTRYRIPEVMLTLIAVASLVHYAISFHPALIISQSWALPKVAWMMALGMLTYRASTRRSGAWLIVALVLAAVAANGVIMFRNDQPLNGHSTWGFKVPFAVAVLYALGRGYRFPRVMVIRALSQVGIYSYSIYLTHLIFGGRVYGLVSMLTTPSDTAIVALFLVALAVSLVSGFVFFHLVEVRLIKASKALRSPANPPAYRPDHTPPLGLAFRLPV